MIDYIIVGFGLAGMSFTEILDRNKKSFVVFEDTSQQSSRIAGGLLNPVILKRFTLAWKVQEQIKHALPLYNRLEERFNSSFYNDLPVLRRFNSIEEQNTWAAAYDKPLLEPFLNPKLVHKDVYPTVDGSHHYGKVKNTGKIEIGKMLDVYIDDLIKRDCYTNKSFEYEKLEIDESSVSYKGIKAKRIVFAEGYGIKKNPFFKYLPMIGNKGEYIIIKSPELKLNEVIKSSIFIIPLGDDLYKVGATYDHHDKELQTTEKAKTKLVKALELLLKVPFEVVNQIVGLRPTVIDRRPLVGKHNDFENLYVLNGLGTRGILIGPTIANELYDMIEENMPLDKEIDIRRFDNKRN